jgi:hypothetical protein
MSFRLVFDVVRHVGLPLGDADVHLQVGLALSRILSLTGRQKSSGSANDFERRRRARRQTAVATDGTQTEHGSDEGMMGDGEGI